jgi:hypothetical protein
MPSEEPQPTPQEPAPQPETVAPAPPSAQAPGTCAQQCPIHKYVVLVPWSAQILIAVVLVQTLYFKFTYAPQTRYIFEPLGGRPVATLVGLVELLAAVTVLVPRTAAYGAFLALGVMCGAILTHLTTLGIVVVDPETGERDGGLLFALALAVTFSALVVLWYRLGDVPWIGPLWTKR